MGESIKLINSVIIAAHPDDEILWFSSILKEVDQVIICFSDELADPSFGAQRKKSLLSDPLENVSYLDLTSIGVLRPQSFVSPNFNQYGIELVGKDAAYSSHKNKYKENYYELKKNLTPILRRYQNVITHNPWGEYGQCEISRILNDSDK